MLTAFLLLMLLISLGNAAVYWWAFRRLIVAFAASQKSNPADGQESSTPVSLVIAARNEEQSLRQNLSAWLNQDLKEYEVIIVDDDSEDGTLALLQEQAALDSRLRVIQAGPKQMPGKKEALAKGIQAASNGWILLTDADCKPAADWAKGMLQAKQSNAAQLVLGYSPYRIYPGWLNVWVRFECLFTAVQYLSAALWGQRYMGVGRNMLYHRSLFESAGGFEQHKDYIGGDDDLFVNGLDRSNETAIAVAPQTWVWTEPKQSWEAYRKQKVRHYSVSHGYKAADQWKLGVFALSHVLFYIGLSFLMIQGYAVEALVLYAMRMLWVWLRMGTLCRLMGYGDLAWRIPVLDFGLAIYYVLMAFPLLGTRWKKPDSWS